MEIVIASTVLPFVKGGDAVIVDSLEEELIARGHSVFTLRFRLIRSTARWRTRCWGYGCWTSGSRRNPDRRPPSYLLRHPNKVLWFIHHHRTAYDLWDSPYREFPDDEEGFAYRDLIYSADMAAFREARKIFRNFGRRLSTPQAFQ